MYYLVSNQQQTGPFTLEQIREQLKDGRATRQTLFWQEGQADWQPLEKLAGAFDPGDLTAPAPLAAPPPLSAPGDVHTPAAAPMTPAHTYAPPAANYAPTPNYAPGNPGGYAPAPGYPGGPMMMTQSPPSSGAAIASLICGLLSVPATFVVFFGLPLALAAIICGHIGRANIRKSGGVLSGGGAAITGLIFGYLMLIVDLAMIGVLIWAFIYASKHPDAFQTPAPTPRPTPMWSN